MADFRYKGFISYSWADAKWGKWLHHALETYRTPATLIGKEGSLGPVPTRLHPLFKDREEEAAGASIGDAVEAALSGSEFLIVICSPQSAKSEWVNREIAWFKTHRDPAKVLALIVEGEPGSADQECFPAALTHEIASDLSLTDIELDSPLAADARDSGDGKRGARLKLAAAMLGVGLDELVKRDERRRTLRTRIVVGASLALAIIMSGMAWVAVEARNEADRQRAEADGLVEFMLTDLREKLEPVGRLDALDVVGERALEYYAGQKLNALDADSLGRRSRALHLVGEMRNIRGDSEAGLKAFTEAAATTGELLARDPNNGQRVFDHAQSVFWVGYIAFERGQTDDAEAQFKEYKRLADRLIALDPENPEWQMESSYAETNLGVMLFNQGRYAEAEPAFATGLKMVEQVAAGETDNPERQMEVGLALNWLGSAQSEVSKVPQALATHRREVALYRNVLAQDAGNNSARARLAVALQYVGKLELDAGDTVAAVSEYDQSLDVMRQLRSLEPANTEWQETELRAFIGQIDGQLHLRRYEAARALVSAASASVSRLRTTDPTNAVWAIELHSSVQLRKAQLAMAEDNPREAQTLARAILQRLSEKELLDAPNIRPIIVGSGISSGDALAQMGRGDEAAKVWQTALKRLVSYGPPKRLWALRAHFILLKRLGRIREAAEVAGKLERQGDQHPVFLRELS